MNATLRAFGQEAVERVRGWLAVAPRTFILGVNVGLAGAIYSVVAVVVLVRPLMADSAMRMAWDLALGVTGLLLLYSVWNAGVSQGLYDGFGSNHTRDEWTRKHLASARRTYVTWRSNAYAFALLHAALWLIRA